MNKIKLPSKLNDALIQIGYIIGTSPVLNSEEEAMYWHLFESIVDTLRPEDPHEFFLIKTIVDSDWQNNRYERAKAKIIDLRAKEALANILRRIIEDGTIIISREEDAEQLAQDFYPTPKRKKQSKTISLTMVLMKMQLPRRPCG
jgi:hypothetical protein